MWRGAACLAVLAWMLAVAIWANSSWTDSVPLTTPLGVEPRTASFTCSAPFDSRVVEREDPDDEGQYPPSQEPCDVHGERRALAVFDMALGVALLGSLLYLGTRRSPQMQSGAAPG